MVPADTITDALNNNDSQVYSSGGRQMRQMTTVEYS